MDRHALFIDAGYLLMAGGEVCVGAQRRAEIACDVPQLVSALAKFTEADSGLPLLRTYWYDGASGPDGQPSTDQYRVAGIPNLKLRLGRIVARSQKGVDSLIMRDMMTLARERAVATMYLLSGDEDLREGVVAAQDMGVRVVLVGLPPATRSRQSFRLINECDDAHALDKDFWTPFFTPTVPADADRRLERWMRSRTSLMRLLSMR